MVSRFCELEAPGGVEPPTNSLGNCCSIQLSYGATASIVLPAFAASKLLSSAAPSNSDCPTPKFVINRLDDPHGRQRPI